MKTREMLVGLAIGDAFGAGVEFQDRDWIRKHVDFTRFVNARGKIEVSAEKKELFTKNYKEWDYTDDTDDTEMTIGLIKALFSEEEYTTELLIQKWEKEYKQGKEKKGYGRNGHGSMSWYFSGEMTIEEIRNFQKNRHNPGNAPAMRSVPLGLIAAEKINEYATINANATHPNINAILSSQCIARAAAFLLVKGGNEEKVIDYCLEKVDLNEGYKTYLQNVNELVAYAALKEKDFEKLCGKQPIEAPYFLAGIKGVPSDSKFTTGCVLYVLKNSKNAMDALRKSVYLGGDVDSIASITTGIMAGKTGLASIPKFMLENVEGLSYLEEIAMKFDESRRNIKTEFPLLGTVKK